MHEVNGDTQIKNRFFLSECVAQKRPKVMHDNGPTDTNILKKKLPESMYSNYILMSSSHLAIPSVAQKFCGLKVVKACVKVMFLFV